jgi:non-canonical purine NTP pyrophosphatase (RdgB/HAM1 family)
MLYFITGNAGKFRELQAVIPDIEQLKLDVDEIQSLDPQKVIEHKLEQAAAQHEAEFIVEDTSVIFNCLDPLPGTLIKWFEEGMGIDRVAELVERYDDHGGRVRTTIGYRDAAGASHFFAAEYEGTFVPRRGEGGFGFDPIFIAKGQTKTNAELTPAEKNAFSARGKAAQKLAEHLKQRPQA